MSRRPGWENVPRDPDAAADLGYDLLKLDVLRTSVGGESRILVLPADEELLRGDAFLVADEGDVRDLRKMV